MNRKQRGIGSLAASRSGQMPFALIAVTLLLLGSAYGVVYSNINRAEENTDGIETELNSVDEIIDEAESRIEQGAGQILCDLSRTGAGTLTERLHSFDGRMNDWAAANFPYGDRGAEVELIDCNISVGVESLRLSAGNRSTDGQTAAFLKASGTATVRCTASTGSTVKVIDVSADGTCGLPFLVEGATRFELSSSGDASALTQIVTYELTTLAQQRVVNGYGALSVGGSRGTYAVITEADVERALRNAIDILETICFRCNGSHNDLMVDADKIDAAELIVASDGHYCIDVSAIIAQTLLSMLDFILIKWFDYFCGNIALDTIDKIADDVKKCIDCIVAFVSGSPQQSASARPYLERVLGNGYGTVSGSYSINVSGGTYTSYVSDEEYTVTIRPVSVNVPFPQNDLMSWGGWNNFIDRYHADRNDIRESFRNVLKTVAVGIASRARTVNVDANAYDGRSFSDSFSTDLSAALADCWSGVGPSLSSTIANGTISDPLFVAMYQDIIAHRAEIYAEDSYRDKVAETVRQAVGNSCSENGELLDDSILNTVMAEPSVTAQIDAADKSYRNAVGSMIGQLRDILTDIPKSNDSIWKDVMIKTGSDVLSKVGILESAIGMAKSVCQCAVCNIAINSRSGLQDLPGAGSFTLYDSDGNSYEEFTSMSDSASASISISIPDGKDGSCLHATDVSINSMAPYTTVYRIVLNAEISYSIRSTSAVLDALDTFDSAASGSFVVGTTLDVACVSGWALTGIDYRPTANFLDDVWKLLVESLSPLFGPLRELYAAVEKLFDICSTAIVEVSKYLNELVMQFYEVLEVPLAHLQDFISASLGEVIGGTLRAFDIGLGQQSITIGYMGLEMKIETKLLSILASSKTLFKITLSGKIGDTTLTAFLEAKDKKNDGIILRGGGGLSGKDWNINLAVDPLLKFGKTLVAANGSIRGVDFTATMPTLIEYEKAEARLSDVPGVGSVLSSIPLPIPGMKGSFDMGVELKYNLPFATGLLINEFESNPAGDDRDNEWVELYNATSKTVDLAGYMLVPGSGESKAMIITGTVIPAWDRAVIYFDGVCLNNSKSGKFSGEKLSLFDPEGNLVDETPWKKDGYNNSLTWQRVADGSSKWDLLEGTEGRRNGGIVHADAVTQSFILDCFVKAGERAFADMGDHLTSFDDITKLLEKMLRHFFDAVIEKLAGCLISASVFIEIEAQDYAETQHYGARIALEIGSDLIEQGLKWLLKQIPGMGDLLGSPDCRDPLDIVCENTYLRTTVYAGIGAPKFMNKVADGTKIEVGVTAAVNISGLCDLAGRDQGKWKAQFGIVMEDVPSAFIPSVLKANDDKHCDLWLLQVDFSQGKNA